MHMRMRRGQRRCPRRPHYRRAGRRPGLSLGPRSCAAGMTRAACLGSPRPSSISMNPSRRTREHTASVTPVWTNWRCAISMPFAAAGDLAPGRQRGRAELNAERRPGFGGRNDEDGSLNLEHGDLLNEQTRGQTVRTESGCGLVPSCRGGRIRFSCDLRGNSRRGDASVTLVFR